MTEQVREIQQIVKRIENGNLSSEMVINPHGARIEELRLLGVKILSTVKRGDGKEGSSHPCSPLFGLEIDTHFGLPQHGTMRDSQCRVVKNERPRSTVVLNYKLNKGVKQGSYPGVKVSQNFELSNGVFTLDTFHSVRPDSPSNPSKVAVPVNFAEHFYWDTPQGWEGLRINGIDVTNIVKQDGIIELGERNTIEIPEMRTIILGTEGFGFAKLWAFKNPETGVFDSNYVCIEPVEGDPTGFFGSEKSLIKPGGIRETKVRISLAKG